MTTICRQAYATSAPQAPWEEEGTLWVWAWPELLGWPQRILWLFSPVVGREVFPGDLVGVDETGRLILLEAKRGVSPADPFEDYVGMVGHFRDMPTKQLLQRWESLLSDERIFVHEHLDNLQLLATTKTKCPGIVPYSCQRYAIAKWEALYRERILPLLEVGGEYEVRVRQYLDRREESGRAAVSFIGLLTAYGKRLPRLSGKGQTAMAALEAEVGTENVHLRAVQAVLEGKEVVIRSWAMAAGSPSGA